MNILSKSLSSKPGAKKIALLIAIRHVHRQAGISLANLEFAHRDAEELRNALIGMCHLVTSDQPINLIDLSISWVPGGSCHINDG